MNWFSRGDWNGHVLFQCNFPNCHFDCLDDEKKMLQHVTIEHAGAFRVGTDRIFEWNGTRPSVNICLLSWNLEHVIQQSVAAALREVLTLRSLGCHTNLVVADNGSSDATQSLLHNLELPDGSRKYLFDGNRGNSKTRNFMIDDAKDSDYILLIDGDIVSVRDSVKQMVAYMEHNPKVGCFGANAMDYTSDPDDALQQAEPIRLSFVRHTKNIAWTQYGLFRSQCFRDGVRFPEQGPFGEPGYGFEDNDLFMQLVSRGWGVHHFLGMRYLHLNKCYSVRELYKSGVDAKAAWEARKREFMKTWGHHPELFKVANFVSAADMNWKEFQVGV